MGMKYTPVFTEFSQIDFNNLDGSLKRQILKSLIKIENYGMNTGQPLYGNLSDCRKLKHKRLGIRVIFRQSEAGMEIVEIVIIRKREDDEVYEAAAVRLGRV
jgi:mRNA interferase RelE/StbE